MRRQCRAFTLVEVLVVMGIIAVMIALLFPAIGGAIVSMNEVHCQNNLAQLAKVVQAYCGDFKGSFPLYATQYITGSASNWLYNLTTGGAPDWRVDDNGNFLNPGLLIKYKYIGDESILYCPADQRAGLPRPSGAITRPVGGENVAPTSYVINGSITYGGGLEGGTQDAYQWSSWARDKTPWVQSRNIGDFDPGDFLFIEQSSGVSPEPPSAFDRGYMIPDSSTYSLTTRHRDGGFVSCMDGHAEWFSRESFERGMRTVFAGGTYWYRNTPTRPPGTPAGKLTDEEIGARWNPG